MPRPNSAYLPATVLARGGRQGIRRVVPHGGQLPGDIQRAGQGPARDGRGALAKGPRAPQAGTLCAGFV